MISPPAGIPAGPEWKQFLYLGEELVRQPTAADQCRVLTATVEQLTHSRVDVWLAQPYYPLPGESNAQILPNKDAPALVKRAFETREPCCTKDDKFLAACDCLSSGPRQVAFPMITQDFLVAVLTLERGPEQEPFTPEDLDYLEGLAANAAMAMQISRQVAIKNWRNSQLSLVRSVTRASRD